LWFAPVGSRPHDLQPATRPSQDVTHPPHALSPADADALSRFSRHYDTSEVYAAYEVVAEAAARPFRTSGDTTLFGAARWAAQEGVIWVQAI
jgi:hypothetical protein